MQGDPEVLEGSCACGKVRYRARGPFGTMDNCHCTDCRKINGAAFATYIEVPKDRLEYLGGGDQLQTYTAASGTKRAFCRTCGSTLVCWVDSDPVIEVAAGAVDTPLARRPQSHIFVRSKAPWFDIQDGMPQFPASRT